jgi:hypothetical protein
MCCGHSAHNKPVGKNILVHICLLVTTTTTMIKIGISVKTASKVNINPLLSTESAF